MIVFITYLISCQNISNLNTGSQTSKQLSAIFLPLNRDYSKMALLMSAFREIFLLNENRLKRDQAKNLKI